MWGDTLANRDRRHPGPVNSLSLVERRNCDPFQRRGQSAAGNSPEITKQQVAWRGLVHVCKELVRQCKPELILKFQFK